MTKEEINDLMATEVMRGEQFDTKHGIVWKFRGIQGISVDKWTPTTDMNQAMECLLKSEVAIETHTDFDDVYLEGEWFGRFNTVAELACLLCKAILKAKGLINET